MLKKLEFMKRILNLPEEMQFAFIEDIEATIEERLGHFEKIAKLEAAKIGVTA